MIKKIIDKLFGKSGSTESGAHRVKKSPFGKRQEVTVKEHGINPQLVDERAMDVVRTLKQGGFEAFVVGGAVRDLLVGLRPKDFDVATDATPEQVKSLFRRAFIIGRRFRIVHVIYGRGREHEVIEVSTFRAHLDSSLAEQVGGNERTSKSQLAGMKHAVDSSGRVLRDNVWGSMEEDAARRDFTINAMYYDPVTQTVVDYHGGLADVRAKLLRMIGDPETRYREDPVRIIRAVRFAAKLGFGIEPKTRQPIAGMAALLVNVPPSRLFDETIKLLQTGHALASIEELKKQGLVGGEPTYFPVLDAVLAPTRPHPLREPFVRAALEDTDRRVAEGRAVAPSFMLACMMWHDVVERWQALTAAGEPAFPALQQAVDAVFEARIGDISGRGKLGGDMREIWLMQPRFERRTVSSAHALAGQARFRAGYDFLRLRAEVGEVPVELADWWEDFHLGTEEEREALLADVRAKSPPRVRRVAAAPRAGGAADGEDAGQAQGEAEEGADDDEPQEPGAAEPAPRRKRRRRRRPAGGGGGAAASGNGEPAA